jgi:hypothetical protein
METENVQPHANEFGVKKEDVLDVKNNTNNVNNVNNVKSDEDLTKREIYNLNKKYRKFVGDINDSREEKIISAVIMAKKIFKHVIYSYKNMENPDGTNNYDKIPDEQKYKSVRSKYGIFCKEFPVVSKYMAIQKQYSQRAFIIMLGMINEFEIEDEELEKKRLRNRRKKQRKNAKKDDTSVENDQKTILEDGTEIISGGSDEKTKTIDDETLRKKKYEASDRAVERWAIPRAVYIRELHRDIYRKKVKSFSDEELGNVYTSSLEALKRDKEYWSVLEYKSCKNARLVEDTTMRDRLADIVSAVKKDPKILLDLSEEDKTALYKLIC